MKQFCIYTQTIQKIQVSQTEGPCKPKESYPPINAGTLHTFHLEAILYE